MALLSVVVANYNYGRYLDEAILSIVSQDGFDQCELIVVDGGSTDNSVEVIRRYADKISWWVSEKDGGQSEAFNKGFAHAKGKYLTWVNADDILAQGSLMEIVRQLNAHPECEWFTGNMFRFLESNKKVMEIDWGPHWYPSVLQRKSSPVVVFGEAAIFSKKIFDQVGQMDETLHFTMDSDLWIRFIAAGIKQRRINCFCWGFRMHGASKTAEFEGHERKDKSKPSPRLVDEWNRSVGKTGYKISRFLTFAIRAWRIVDGSYLRKKMLERMYFGCACTSVAGG